MKKIFAVFVSLILLSLCASGQTGNEWIDFNQQYYKIQTAVDGLYRLTFADLQNAGVPVASIDPKTIRIFHRGVEQAIVIQGESDNQFDAADYVEFYGLRNDGTLDASLYKPSILQPHKFYNLFCDTTAFFLTYGGGGGKRMAIHSEGGGSLTPETYHLNLRHLNTIEVYSGGQTYNTEVLQTFFDLGEGWMSRIITSTTPRAYTASGVSNGDPTSGKPTLEVFLIGRNTGNHQTEVSVGASPRVLGTVSSVGFNSTSTTFPIEWTDVVNGNVTVTLKALGAGDWMSISYMRVIYPQSLNTFGETQKMFYLRANPVEKSFVRIQNPGSGMKLYDVTDADNVIAIEGTLSGTFDAVVPNTNSSRKLLAASTVMTPVISEVTFTPFSATEYDYIILTHPVLRAPAEGYGDPVQAYADYRASTAGGGFHPVIVDINQVYDQFNYGEIGPGGIFNMMKYFTSVNLPRYFFILGKGLEIGYDDNRDQGRFTTYRNLVPAAGYPASDSYFTVGLAGNPNEVAVPTGRLTASSADEVAHYLDKVKETESQPIDNQRRKNLLHLSGGIEEGEPERFRGYVDEFAAKAETYYLGGKVKSIAKRSRDIELISIADEVNAGLGLVTFFGHSSSSTLDFDIGYVSDPIMNYSNSGKYPMMLIHGCNAGSFFIDDYLFGEDWILAKQKGALGFIAHTFFGFEVNLKKYGDIFYSTAFNDSVYVYKGIGDIMKQVSHRYLTTYPATADNVTQAQQMILLGDPAVALFPAKKSDLEINANTISFESFNGTPITALSDSFKVNVIVRNFGQARPDRFRIVVERVFNDGTVLEYDSIVDPVLYSETFAFTIRRGSNAGFGNNKFSVTVDADDLIDELSESNNSASHDLFIPLNGTKNLFPNNFAVLDRDQATLTWQTTDVLSAEREFTLEFDTVNTFDSPFKKSFTTTARVLARQEVTLLDRDSITYFWRTRLAVPLAGENLSWDNSSFSRVKTIDDGWGQLHFQQYTSNSLEGLLLDEPVRMIKFEETITPVTVKTFGASNATPFYNSSVKIKGAEYNLYTQGLGCRDNSINLIAFDKNSTTPYIGVPFKWYNRLERACGREPWVINNFQPGEMVTGNNDDIVAYVDNIAVGDSVLLFSIGDAQFASWPMSAKVKLGELGISLAQLSSLTPGEPVVIFGKKGISPGSATFYRAPSSPETAELEVVTSVTGGFSDGKMVSTVIGPAIEWKFFHEEFTDKESQDNVSFNIVGISLDGEQTTLFENVSDGQELSTVDAALYPYLKLIFNSNDDLNLTSPQLQHWIVSYTPVPEGLIMFFGSPQQQLVTEGATWSGDYGFVNISDRTFPDSLTVRTESFNHILSTSESYQTKIKAPAPGDTTLFQVDVFTQGKSGLNDVNVFVNPRLMTEQYYENNVLSLIRYLDVEKDFFHPVLDVTVDGRRLKEGDFVSPNPLITAAVWDENKNILKQSIAGMQLFLTYPCDQIDCSPVAIDLNSDQVTWFPATATSDFRIEFRPKNLSDGYYILTVHAADAQGNASGADPYSIGFVVQTETTVTILPPYPNPSSGDMRFSVVVSGEETPSGIVQEVVDLTGKQIRSYAPNEVHIGTNEWTWDGNDAFGNPVRPGVYIYKILFTIRGIQYRKNCKVVIVR